MSIEIVGRKPPCDGSRAHARRWVVERTNGSINHNRHPVRQHETTAEAHERFPIPSQIALILRKLDRGQLFDTL